LIGENEIKENKVSLKNMDSGEQTSVNIEEIEKIIKG
jgi:histidyl-tRNA synthetase